MAHRVSSCPLSTSLCDHCSVEQKAKQVLLMMKHARASTALGEAEHCIKSLISDYEGKCAQVNELDQVSYKSSCKVPLDFTVHWLSTPTHCWQQTPATEKANCCSKMLS